MEFPWPLTHSSSNAAGGAALLDGFMCAAACDTLELRMISTARSHTAAIARLFRLVSQVSNTTLRPASNLSA